MEGGRTVNKVKDFICHLLFLAGFIFVASGMLEAVILRLLEVIGW